MTWQEAWRTLQQQFKTKGLTALAAALRSEDDTVLRCETAASRSSEDDTCVAACPIGYCGWQGEDLKTSGQVERFFELFSLSPEGMRFVDLFDDCFVSYAELAAEIDAELERRGEAVPILL